MSYDEHGETARFVGDDGVEVEIDMNECSVQGCEETENLQTVETLLDVPGFGAVPAKVPACIAHIAIFRDGSTVSVAPAE